jgi:hypothetical protein
VEINKSGRRKRSSSCPRERRDKESHLKAKFFSPVTMLVASSESHLHPKRGIFLNFAVIVFRATWEYLLILLYCSLGTPLKGTKIQTLVKKMPDFTSIHKKEFQKMESVVDCHQRKLERARTLFSPKALKVRRVSINTPGRQLTIVRTYNHKNLIFFVIPFYLQSVPVQ